MLENSHAVLIPTLSLVPSAQLLDITPIALQQTLYYYYLNWKSPTPWFGTILVKFKNLTSPQALRNLRNTLPRAVDSGYHFSYMGGVDRIILKMTSIVDGNQLVVESKDNLIDRKHIEQTIKNGKDIYKRDGVKDFLPCDVKEIDLPYLKEFIQKYPYFVKNED